MAEFDLDKMADEVAEKALDEFTYKDKTLREWIEIIVAQDLLAITELEKTKAEAEELIELCDSDYEFEEIYGINSVVDIINRRIAELKGENK